MICVRSVMTCPTTDRIKSKPGLPVTDQTEIQVLYVDGSRTIHKITINLIKCTANLVET